MPDDYPGSRVAELTREARSAHKAYTECTDRFRTLHKAVRHPSEVQAGILHNVQMDLVGCYARFAKAQKALRVYGLYFHSN